AQIRELPAGSTVRFEGYEIRAFATDHAPGSMGLALVEGDRLGRFDVARARALGVPEGPLFGRLHRGEPVDLADGRVVRPEEVVGPARPGRRLVYSGDTRPSSEVERAAASADLLIHESTFSDEERERAETTRHSTAREAAELAARAGAARLVLTHFSARHSDQPQHLLREAREAFPGASAAEDGLVIELPLRDAGAEAG
ncbi:MAG: MBL fold metallo-hydrolase, partial [Gemmatimonadota bacterium]